MTRPRCCFAARSQLPPLAHRRRPSTRTPGVATAQTPIGSGFDASSTAADVIAGIDLTGSVAVVTGGHAGLGIETVRALTGAGASVVVPARDVDRATRGLDGIDRVEVAW